MKPFGPDSPPGEFDTFLFDLGGVLVNDLRLNYDVSIRIFKMLGKRRLSMEEYVANLLPIEKLYRFVGLSPEESRQSHKLFRQFMSEKIESVPLQPDAKPILEALKREGRRLGVVTQYPRVIADRILAMRGMADYFGAVVGFEDSDEQKPSAKPVLGALERLGSKPETSVFVGDMKEDILAGQRAGVRTVGIYRGREAYHSYDILLNAHPDLIIKDLNEVTKFLAL